MPPLTESKHLYFTSELVMEISGMKLLTETKLCMMGNSFVFAENDMKQFDQNT